MAERTLANRFAAMGAGFQGKMPEFYAQEERQRLAQERAQLMQQQEATQRQKDQLLFGRAVNDQLSAGNYDLAITGLNNRLVELNARGADTGFTQGIRNLLDAGPDGVQEAQRILTAGDQEAVTREILDPVAVADPIQLSANERLIDPATRKVLIDVVPDAQEAITQTPPALLAGLDPQTQERASAAFVAAGGGSAGVNALNDQVALGAESQQRADVPQMLSASFPNASPAERAQLDAAVAGAKSVDAGMKIASDIRTEQRRLTKAKGFQQRAVQLLNGILANTELNAVIGPIQGSAAGFHMLDPMETDVIADINEIQDILTAENMDLMTGVLSESDIQLLKNLSSGALNRTRSEDRFRRDATTLRDKLSSALVETVDDVAGAEPNITTREEFDALPSGSFFIQDGERRQKP